MTPEQFCFWLQGYSEVQNKIPSEAQWVIIQDHLKEVFVKKTPVRDTNTYIPDPLKGFPNNLTLTC